MVTISCQKVELLLFLVIKSAVCCLVAQTHCGKEPNLNGKRMENSPERSGLECKPRHDSIFGFYGVFFNQVF